VDKNGFSPVFWVSVDEVALMLIKAGASPAGIDENCWTLLDWAKERKMPKLSNWLLAHQEEWKDRPETKKACTPSNL
jgi:hypothetical protein